MSACSLPLLLVVRLEASHTTRSFNLDSRLLVGSLFSSYLLKKHPFATRLASVAIKPRAIGRKASLCHVAWQPTFARVPSAMQQAAQKHVPLLRLLLFFTLADVHFVPLLMRGGCRRSGLNL